MRCDGRDYRRVVAGGALYRGDHVTRCCRPPGPSLTAHAAFRLSFHSQLNHSTYGEPSGHADTCSTGRSSSNRGRGARVQVPHTCLRAMSVRTDLQTLTTWAWTPGIFAAAGAAGS
ncbi:hypothetical protein CHLRE_13g563926v5 [Chlamydomonas reinhardtii]|uniref:Uncharacterized protein n=1 Tax=Chlamydomonas reinhardtii TaxID=3055 RepID=A0A2K3CZ52_CHLRE|nr:uncharacterized protein CHLRE_13g563926v5 [Chlamydomonas reinhardtii]PNW73558.1 hypothetical protein CHLRE_13g563926v5 [Chlamydomonas reinhardtii]